MDSSVLHLPYRYATKCSEQVAVKSLEEDHFYRAVYKCAPHTPSPLGVGAVPAVAS